MAIGKGNFLVGQAENRMHCFHSHSIGLNLREGGSMVNPRKKEIS